MFCTPPSASPQARIPNTEILTIVNPYSSFLLLLYTQYFIASKTNMWSATVPQYNDTQYFMTRKTNVRSVNEAI